MSITLDAETGKYLEEQAPKMGLRDAGEYVRQLVRQTREQPEPSSPTSRTSSPNSNSPGWAEIRRIAGTATSGLTADQIMEMTRSEV